MAKIDRYGGNLEAFASEAIGQERTVFGTETFDDSLTAQINALFRRGWGIVAPADAPKLQDFNALGYTTTQVLAYLHQMGIAEWNAAQEYYEGSVVTTLAGIYRLKPGGVGSSDPDTDGGINWELIPTQAKVDAKADKATTYTKTEANSLLDAKADQATTYTKTEAAVDFGSTTDDLDTVVKSGFYRIQENANLPPGADYGQLIVSRGEDTILQLVSDFGGRLWQRSGNPSNTGGNGSYSDWQEIPSLATTYTKTEVDDLVATRTESPDETAITGTATFTNLTNNIALTGIGSIGLEIGDVVQVTGTASNNKLFTVEVITDSGNVIVNQAHAGGTTTKSLVDETVSATVTLIAKWFNAPIGLGQGWVAPSRSPGVTYTNNTLRAMSVNVQASTSNRWPFTIDGLIIGLNSNTTVRTQWNPIIPPESTYSFAVAALRDWTELR